MSITVIPALLRLLLVFALVIICVRKKLSLGNAFCLGAISMGILFGLGPLQMGRSMAFAVIAPKTLGLAIIVSLILVLSKTMEKSGQMKRMLESFKGLIRHPRLNIIVFPALIGLMPMPGGAVFSAPMVKELGGGSAYSPARLSFINYWFRHLWEYWWPLYPGILLIMALAEGISLTKLMASQAPLTLVALAVGFVYLARPDQAGTGAAEPGTAKSAAPFLRELLPIAVVIVLGLGMGVGLSFWLPHFALAKETGLILALLGAIFLVALTNRMRPVEIRAIVLDSQMLKMVYMIFSILIFKSMLEDSHAVGEITRELSALQVPLILIVAILPFLVGLITGITIAFVGSAFPILIPLIVSFDPGGNLYPYLMLAMVCGFAGVLLSPVHLCLILSNQYFKVRMESVYAFLWKPCLILVAVGFAWFYLLRVIV